MEQIKPNLFLNYERPIGRKWQNSLTGDANQVNVTLSSLRVIDEILIPAAGSGDQAGSTLSAISNAIFIDARRHNMSLSSFSHNDPVKFCLASTYLALMMLEVRTALSFVCHYEFGNKFLGRALTQCNGYAFNLTISNYANLASRYNKLVARVNNLMIPEIKLFKKWMKHRVTIYKDDEGDRYSVYSYRLANIYQLDVDATSPTVGQLKCVWMKDLIRGAGPETTIDNYLNKIEALLATYESDEDMVTFATEAIKAGMNHLTLETVPSTAEAFALIPLSLIYELDDIMSLENARVVHPFIFNSGVTGNMSYGNWNIIEENETFKIGRINLTGLVPAITYFGRLPVYIPQIATANVDKFLVSNCPIFTHAKIKSIEGLESLTRYMASATKVNPQYSAVDNVSGNVYYGYDKKSVALKTTSADNLDKLYGLSLFNTEMICGITCYTDRKLAADNYAGEVLPVVMNYIYDVVSDTTSASTKINKFLELTVGFKSTIACYFKATDETAVPVGVRDYDYITSVTEDSLQNFFEAIAWNYTQLSQNI